MAGGGSRPGSGRKSLNPEAKRVQISLSVTQSTRDKVREMAKKHNIKVGRVIDRMIDNLYKQISDEEI